MPLQHACRACLLCNQSDKPLPAMTTRNWDDKVKVASPSREREREECQLQATVPSELHLLPILRSHRSDRSNALTTWTNPTNDHGNTRTRTEQAEPSERPEPSAPGSQADTNGSKKRREKKERKCRRRPSIHHHGSRPTAPAPAPSPSSRAPRSRPSWRFGSSGCRRGCGMSGLGGRWCPMRLGWLVVSVYPVFWMMSGYGGGDGGLVGVGKGGPGAVERGDGGGGKAGGSCKEEGIRMDGVNGGGLRKGARNWVLVVNDC